jgi:hypothetical protein
MVEGAVTSVAGFVPGLVVITAAGLCVAYLSMPLWYWAVSHPGTEYGLTNFGRSPSTLRVRPRSHPYSGWRSSRSFCCWRAGSPRGTRLSPSAY